MSAGCSRRVPHSRQRQRRRVRRDHRVSGRIRQSGAAIGGHGGPQPGRAAPVSVVLTVMMMVVVMMPVVVMTVIVVVIVVMVAVIVLVIQTAAAVLRVAGVPAPAPVVSVIRWR